MNRQFLILLPSADRFFAAIEIGGNFLPGIQSSSAGDEIAGGGSPRLLTASHILIPE